MDEFISKDKAIKLLEILGGCDASDEYSKGYDEAISAAIYDVRAMKPADVQPISRWINIKDKLPEIGRSVLIYYPYWSGDEIQVAKLENDEMLFDVCGEFDIRIGAVTHWMPLPEPPKDGDAE